MANLVSGSSVGLAVRVDYRHELVKQELREHKPAGRPAGEDRNAIGTQYLQ